MKQCIYCSRDGICIRINIDTDQQDILCEKHCYCDSDSICNVCGMNTINLVVNNDGFKWICDDHGGK